MNQNLRFSVLISVCEKEKPHYLIQCFDSLLQQTIPADEWIIVEDGPLTKDLYRVLALYEDRYPELIKRVRMKRHTGLAAALAEGIESSQSYPCDLQG